MSNTNLGKILVTGANGFLGSRFIKYLKRNGIQFDAVRNSNSGLHVNGSNYYNIDISKKKSLDILPLDYDCIVHLAARTGPGHIDNPLFDFEINALGTINLLDFARKSKINKFVFASSSAIYGHNPGLNITEEKVPNPNTPYALSKFTAEKYVNLYNELYEMENVVLRLFNIYGPSPLHMSSKGVISIIADKILAGKSFDLTDSPNNLRDFVHIDDVVQALSLSLFQSPPKKSIFNIGTGIGTSLMEIANLVIEMTGSSKDLINFNPDTLSSEFNSVANIEAAKKHLDYSSKVNIEKGISMLLEDLRSKRK